MLGVAPNKNIDHAQIILQYHHSWVGAEPKVDGLDGLGFGGAMLES